MQIIQDDDDEAMKEQKSEGGCIMSRKTKKMMLALVLCVGAFVLGASAGSHAGVPKALMGTIITSERDLDLPGQNLMGSLKKQDQMVFIHDSEHRWTLHMVAFFKQPLPVSKMMVVVLDQKKEAVAIAEVEGSVGQDSLACSLVVDSTEYPGKKHTLQVFYMHQGKPVILARKAIVLK